MSHPRSSSSSRPHTSLRTWLAAAVVSTLAAMPATAQSYYKWETVELPAATGATCGNGSPYRFFVNRTPRTTKTVVVYEGGGACWAKGNCSGEGGLLGASNPNGVPANYMSSASMAAYGLVAPFTSRIHPFTAIQTQSWNIIYVPYCTGDVHSGNRINVYPDKDPSQPALTFHHKGAINSEALAAWIKGNMPRPDHLLVTGFSAGGAGATGNYSTLRDVVQPRMQSMLADSGPLMDAPRGSDPAVHPSVRLHEKVRDAWGVDGPEGQIAKLLARHPGYGDPDNIGSIVGALAQVYPQDRMGYAVFQQDQIYSAFSYTDFFPEIQNAANDDERVRLLLAKWQPEVKRWTEGMKPYANVGFYVPYERNLLGSHCLTILGFGGTAIKEANLRSVETFLDNMISRSGPVIRAYESAPVPQSPGVLGALWDSIVKLFTWG